MMEKKGYVYILTNKRNTVLYIGVTSNLVQRISEHKGKTVEGFTKKYNLTELVYIEVYDRIIDAIAREKEIKKWRREKKINLILNSNPALKDLSGSIG